MAACLEAANSERRLTAYLALGGFAGMRTQEIVNQRWDDIDWAAQRDYVRQPKRVGGLATKTYRDPACAPTPLRAVGAQGRRSTAGWTPNALRVAAQNDGHARLEDMAAQLSAT